ncbi:hypothetical protein [Paraburkholderia unamae]|uniref:Uncharacterized protein n=1 Tax=Paraburkholderia unamae TaxID=219649 RepID=A0ABX5KVB3_9BURK|nr:hypothetical protein [Paraburkholderia unamae]PVX84336.1 hypothetical protein C7402_105177 [Paraburkholderia unamae]
MKIERTEWNPLRLTYETADREYRNQGNAIVLYAFHRRVEFALPEFVKPYRRWVDCSGHQWATRPDAGYWDVHRREWGFCLHEGFLQVFFGPQTHDSSTTKSWSKFLPWTQWRHVRKSWFGVDGEHLRTDWETSDRTVRAAQWNSSYEFEKTMPKRTFRFRDYDGEEIEAATHVEEREWRFGEGWFKWLSLFRRPRVRRDLDIAFSKEVGREKGSWKGGTVGHSIEMLDGELHAAAFARYCDKHHLTLID